ncbi:MAG: class I tRNA ligase family protein [Patescibacteria group bacterium]
MIELEKAYNPKDESERAKFEEESGLFAPEAHQGTPEAHQGTPEASEGNVSGVFSMVLPPPNVTGTLHMGSATMLSIEDIMTRFQRMRGKKTLWLPGTDHAAIATQVKVEKILKEKDGKTRFDLGREVFLKKVEEFATESRQTILSQVKRMGCSVDWSREAFTLDEPRNLAVRTVFKKMYDDGLIVRKDRVVNWDPVGKTVISDDELVHIERDATLYTFRYSKDIPISISTTRPETKTGDTAIAVHPKDPRYLSFVGKTYSADFCGAKIKLKVIADESVDQEFGTGALGVTPAHSHIDFELKEKHALEIMPVIGEDARMTKNAGSRLQGKTTEEAREEIVSWLKENDLLEREETIKQNVATAERTGAVIEPLPKLQWFVAVNKPFKFRQSVKHPVAGLTDGQTISLKEVMRHVVATDQITIIPEQLKKVYFSWVNNLRDWCISRQIWYGHPVPVWYRGDEVHIGDASDGDGWVADEDTLDTWFSSGMWTFSTLGWPTTNIILHRHGEADSNVNGYVDSEVHDEKNVLTARGVEQIKSSAEKLKAMKPTAIVASPVLRTKQTAEILSVELGVPVVFDDRLREVGSGKLEGAPADKFLEERGSLENWLVKKPHGVESYSSLKLRLDAALSDIAEKYAGETVIIVSHGDPIGYMMHAGQKGAPEGIAEYPGTGEFVARVLGSDGKINTDFAEFHPTTVLETGRDIIFFWVARMILMSTYVLGEIPFRYVYMHGMVRDDEGRKISKSLGNNIDPVDMADKYGADATRLSLVIGSTPGNDTRLSEEKIASFRNFTNKLWNIGRFVMITAGSQAEGITPKAKTTADEWIMSRLSAVVKSVTEKLDAPKFQLSQAGEELREFTWGDFADWYLEAAKAQRKNPKLRESTDAILVYVLGILLRLWHPFMPFVTSKLWEAMGKKTPLVADKWPAVSHGSDSERVRRFERLKELIIAIRNLRAECGETKRGAGKVRVKGDNADMLLEDSETIIALSGIKEISVVVVGESISGAKNAVAGAVEMFYFAGVENEFKSDLPRLQKEHAILVAFVSNIEERLMNSNFVSRAPTAVIEKEKEKLAEAKMKLDAISSRLNVMMGKD